jgi:hypothetical protein
MIKSQVLSLLTRLIRKLRYILRKELERGRQNSEVAGEVTQEAHLQKIYISPAFIKALLDDMDTFKREEEKALVTCESKESQLLYSSFL